MNRLLRALLIAAIAIAALAAGGSRERAALPVARVDSVGFTVSNMERSVEFYTRVLSFAKVLDVDVDGRTFELLSGLFGARARIVTLALGDERIELTEYLGLALVWGALAVTAPFRAAALKLSYR